jgi:small subunit ribosomal protein S6
VRADQEESFVREYEFNFIIQPEISEEGSATILGKLDGILEAGGATRLLLDDQGKRKLAYPIDKFQKGHYYLLSFLDDGKVVAELERTLRIEESVLRFLTVKVDDEVKDVDARVADAREKEAELQKRLAEKAAREAEEAKARAAAEAEAAAKAEAEAEAEAKAKAEAAENAEGADDGSDDASADAAAAGDGGEEKKDDEKKEESA